jgi:MinD superfamily P-loop ATPase
MRIAVASGKGGTGKTTISVNLAYVASKKGLEVTYVDCDVEEPNGHIFLNPAVENSENVSRMIPEIDEGKCTYCRECSRLCQFNAISVVLETVTTFPELCHGCGGCTLVCKEGAITEVPREIGMIETGKAAIAGDTSDQQRCPGVIQGRLNVGEAISPPVIRRVKELIPDTGLVIIDAPPGSACPMVESIRNADYVVMVTEPTPFGLSDLEMAFERIRELGLPAGIVINRSGIGDGRINEFCARNGIMMLAEISDDREVAEVCSSGGIAAAVVPRFGYEIEALFEALIDGVLAEGIS